MYTYMLLTLYIPFCTLIDLLTCYDSLNSCPHLLPKLFLSSLTREITSWLRTQKSAAILESVYSGSLHTHTGENYFNDKDNCRSKCGTFNIREFVLLADTSNRLTAPRGRFPRLGSLSVPVSLPLKCGRQVEAAKPAKPAMSAMPAPASPGRRPHPQAEGGLLAGLAGPFCIALHQRRFPRSTLLHGIKPSWPCGARRAGPIRGGGPCL